MITEQRAEAAFEYLRDTVALIGEAKGELERSEILRKRERRKVFTTTEGTVAQREAAAEIDPSVAVADDRYIAAVIAYEQLRARRQIEEIAVEVWRTEEASRRRGMV